MARDIAWAEAPGEDEAARYDIAADRRRLEQTLASSPEIDALTSLLDVSDLNTIVTFGADAALGISKAADEVLRGMNPTQLDDTNGLFEALGRVMASVDVDELERKPGPLGKLFGGAQRQLDRALTKYQSLGEEVDRIYLSLRRYEDELERTDRQLARLLDANIASYRELVKYIVAGEQGCREIEDYLNERRAERDATGDASIQFEIQTLEQALEMLRRRTQDLRTAEIVAMQSIPMIQLTRRNNMELARKIDSAFIVTLPAFKQALTQAILLKRQRIQAEALSALDERARELLRRNGREASNPANQSAAQAGAGDAPSLKGSLRTIELGIGEANELRRSATRQREEDRRKLERIQAELAARQAGDPT